jgi:hypothetical protein
MARERLEITEWEYPYNAVDCIKNMKKYGIGTALSHDWERTKENMESRLEEIILGVMTGVVMCIAIPIGIYQLCKINRPYNKRKKQSEESAADEGFYPEVHSKKGR